MSENNLLFIGRKAPSFKGESTKGRIKFPEDYHGSWVIFTAFSGDFTPVSTSEIMRFSAMEKSFRDKNAFIVGVSFDTLHAHLGWLESIKTIDLNSTESRAIDFPLIEDGHWPIARMYNLVHGEAKTPTPLSATFIIDPKGFVRHMQYFEPSTGRNVGEIMRVLEALQLSDYKDIATPEGWENGDDVLLSPPSNKPLADYRAQSEDALITCHTWYMCYMKDKGNKTTL